MPPAAFEPMGENEMDFRQKVEVPLTEQKVVSEQRNARQEPDLMARMTAMLKDLQQEVRLLKEGKTQEVRDNALPVGNQDRTQPEGGSAVGEGTNPQYLTLADVSALLEQEREKLSKSPNNFHGIPHSHQNSLASHIPKDMNPQSSIILWEKWKHRGTRE